MKQQTIYKTLTLPVAVSKNVWQRQFWAARRRTKQEWEALIWGQVNILGGKWPKRVASVVAHVEVDWDKPGPLPDHHNLDMIHECVADGLVKAGVLEDDAKGVYQRGTFRIQRVPRGSARTTVHVELTTAG